MQLYREQAIEDFTLDEIARRAETTVQTVLRAFGSKEELVYAALEEMVAGGVFAQAHAARRGPGRGCGVFRHLRGHGRSRHRPSQRRATPSCAQGGPG